MPCVIAAAGALLITLRDLQKNDLPHIRELELYIAGKFMQHPGKVFTPAELYSAGWNEAPVAIDNTVAVHIRHLREKLEINPSEPRYLKVVWGKGYKLEGDRQ